jgi:DNA-binding MarR family transcriptional regulator
VSSRDESYRGPLLGALLRRCHQEVIGHIAQGLQAMGAARYPATLAQPLYEHAAGLRVTQLAQLGGVTKQAMAEAVDAMEAAGYVERVPDPSDGRAQLVRLTRAGRAIGKKTRALVREVEARWATRVGATRVEALRETLAAIASGLPPDPPSR